MERGSYFAAAFSAVYFLTAIPAVRSGFGMAPPWPSIQIVFVAFIVCGAAGGVAAYYGRALAYMLLSGIPLFFCCWVLSTSTMLVRFPSMLSLYWSGVPFGGIRLGVDFVALVLFVTTVTAALDAMRAPRTPVRRGLRRLRPSRRHTMPLPRVGLSLRRRTRPGPFRRRRSTRARATRKAAADRVRRRLAMRARFSDNVPHYTSHPGASPWP